MISYVLTIILFSAKGDMAKKELFFRTSEQCETANEFYQAKGYEAYCLKRVYMKKEAK